MNNRKRASGYGINESVCRSNESRRGCERRDQCTKKREREKSKSIGAQKRKEEKNKK